MQLLVLPPDCGPRVHVAQVRWPEHEGLSPLPRRICQVDCRPPNVICFLDCVDGMVPMVEDVYTDVYISIEILQDFNNIYI